MTDQNIQLTDEDLDAINEEVKKTPTSAEIAKNLKTDDRSIVNDPSAEDEVHLGELGTYKRANPDDVKDVFEKLTGTIFQLKTCLFRVSFIDKDQNKFTAELINPPN